MFRNKLHTAYLLFIVARAQDVFRQYSMNFKPTEIKLMKNKYRHDFKNHGKIFQTTEGELKKKKICPKLK